ncbi:MAG: hypothetical protein QXH20_00415 [Candidatus Bathyarchaeia archaeon]
MALDRINTPKEIVYEDEHYDEFINCLKTHYNIKDADKQDWYILFDFEWRKILYNPKHGLWLFYSLTPRQRKYLNQKINPLTCWKTARLCEGENITNPKPPLGRPHFTCLVCHFRKVIEGKKPLATPISLHMVFITPTNNPLKALLRHYLLTFAEALSY